MGALLKSLSRSLNVPKTWFWPDGRTEVGTEAGAVAGVLRLEVNFVNTLVKVILSSKAESCNEIVSWLFDKLEESALIGF